MCLRNEGRTIILPTDNTEISIERNNISGRT